MESNSNTRTLMLDEILTPTQLVEVERIVNAIKSQTQPKVSLREYLESQKKDLLAKEILPAFLYYALCYKLGL